MKKITLFLIFVLLICCPLAIFMGVPFPSMIAQLDKYSKPLIPWAIGINGFASVTAAVLGMSLSISTGFNVLVFLALGCYLLAGILARRVATPNQ